MRELCGLGLRIAVVDGGRVYDATSLTGDLMPEIEAMLRGNLAFKESQQKSERVLDALTKKMAKGQREGHGHHRQGAWLAEGAAGSQRL